MGAQLYSKNQFLSQQLDHTAYHLFWALDGIGWGVDARQQALVHTSGVRIPIEMQNRSMAARGWIRVLREEPRALGPVVIRAEGQMVLAICQKPELAGTSMLKVLELANTIDIAFKNPTVVCGMSGSKFRTTLIQNGAVRAN